MASATSIVVGDDFSEFNFSEGFDLLRKDFFGDMAEHISFIVGRFTLHRVTVVEGSETT